MDSPVSLTTSLGWARHGQGVVEAAVSDLDEDDVKAPSLLPGWTRGHVATHLARNADACVNLLTWARTGRECQMYPSAAVRDADITAGAHRPPAALTADLEETAGRLEEAVAAMTDEAWAATVATASGRWVPAGAVAWMRARELWVHAVDLDAGVGWHDLPAGVAEALVDEAVDMFAGRQQTPAVQLVDGVGGRRWRIGDGDGPVVTGAVVDLAAWISGRGEGEGLECDAVTLPDLGRWI